MLPLLERPQVAIEDADYIVYMHPYARCEDLSQQVVRQIRILDSMRKPEAEIIVVGKAANAESLLNGSVTNITFWHDHFTEKLGKKFGINSLDVIRENLDLIRAENPRWLRKISLRAENLTEYGIDLYGEQKLDELLDLLNSYEEIKTIEFPIGLAIGEMQERILDAFCRFKSIERICMNPEVGNDRLCQLIGKNHTREQVIHVFKTLRKAHPEVIFDIVVMIGLPTETITDIYDLASLVGEIEADDVMCNYYIKAPNQPLAKLPQISESLREYHLKIFQKALCSTLRRECYLTCWKVYKSKRTRKYAREVESLKMDNKERKFPMHNEMTYYYRKHRV